MITDNDEEIQNGKLENQGIEGLVGEEDDKSTQISTPRNTGFGQISTKQETIQESGNEENSTITICIIIIVENRLHETKNRIKKLWAEEVLKKLVYSKKKRRENKVNRGGK